MKIILLIKQERKENKITLKQLSKKSGVSKTHISDIENGYKGPSLEVMIKLSKALNVPIQSLYKVQW